MISKWEAIAWSVSTCGLLTTSTAWGQGEVYILKGLLEGERTGASVGFVGDINGDGTADLAGAGPGEGGNQGQIRVWSGLSGELILSIQQPPSSPATPTSISSAGDVNADTVPDILVANYLHQSSATGAMWAGAVWVYSGADGSELYAFEGTESSELVGAGVAGGADLNRDGYADFAIGIPGRRRPNPLGEIILQGGIDVRSGKDGSILYQIQADALGSGGAVPALLNDLNGDGIPDFVASGNATVPSGPDTMLRWFSGKDGSTFLTYNHTPDQVIGTTVASAGDVDGDGLFDVVVGNPSENNGTSCPGTVRIFSSADATPLLYFPNPGGSPCENVGRSVAGLGDFDGDGVPDVAVGTNPPASTAFVVSGMSGQILFQQSGEFGSYYGFSVAGPGDLNGDGLGDLSVGHPFASGFLGNVHVYLAGCPGPVAYCTAKVNSQGCLPELEWTGLLSLSIADNFTVRTTKVVSQQLGMLLWSRNPAALPFQGGTLCLAAPLERLTPQSTGGNSTPDCSGVLSQHLSQDLATLEGWAAGDDLYAQFWYRDPAHPDGTAVGLTEGVRFQACP